MNIFFRNLLDNDVTRRSSRSSNSSTSSSSQQQITSISLDRSNELELVNEIVEQALVDNLLDGEFYSANEIELINAHVTTAANRQRDLNQRTNPSSILNSDQSFSVNSASRYKVCFELLKKETIGWFKFLNIFF